MTKHLTFPPATNSICDAEDKIADALDLVELIRMAHCAEPDEEDKAVSTACILASNALKEAITLLRRAKGQHAEATNP